MSTRRNRNDPLEGMPAPVILIGTHRSGTSLVAALLRDAGLFIGSDLDPNLEPVALIQLNDLVLRACGGSWDRPAAVRDLLADPSLFEATATMLGRMLGHRGRAKVAGSGNRAFCWGWKDPRNTQTLPLWLRLFPEARVVRVSRHGADVAQSLVNRERANAAYLVETISAPRSARGDARLASAMTASMQYSFRCTTLDGAFDLWCEYEQAASDHTTDLGENAVHLRYESIADDLPALIAFCGLECSPELLDRLRRQVDPTRSFAHRSDPSLLALAERRADALAKFGY